MPDDRNKTTINTYNNTAKVYQEKFMDMDLYNATLDKFCTLIEKDNALLFEIACGPGNVTRYLLKKQPGYKILGIDLAPNMVELAKQNVPDANFEVMDCREITIPGQKFDAIMCGFCMPYLSKEECCKLIADSAKLLHKGGIFYFSTMEGDYGKSGYETTSFSGEDKVYIYYHQEDFLTECLNKSGFHLVELIRKKYPEPDGSFLTDMVFIVRKK